VSYLVAAYAITAVSLIVYAGSLLRERRRLSGEIFGAHAESATETGRRRPQRERDA